MSEHVDDPHTAGHGEPPVSAEEALHRLADGNARFLRGESRFTGMRREDLDPQLAPEQRLRAAVEANVRWTLRQIQESPEGRARIAEGQLKLVGAIYELESGRVRFLDDAP